MKKTRERIPDQMLQDVLLKSRRRCCLCYAEGNDQPQAGAIAHIDHDPKNTNVDNLVFLCLNHHSSVDSGRYVNEEIELARSRLYDDMAEESPQSAAMSQWQAFENHVHRGVACINHFQCHENARRTRKESLGRSKPVEIVSVS